MAWVRRHHRRAPGSWFRTTTVRSHYRTPVGRVPLVAIVIGVLLLLVIIASL